MDESTADHLRPTSVVRLPAGHGSVRGLTRADVTAFYGIPYAAPPTGALRFSAPAPPTAWNGVRDASRPGAWAPQPAEHDASPLPRRIVEGDDYLTVNVWTCDVHGSAPVMVFVHGGSFIAGSGAMPGYDGSTLAREGIVVVTINYRLGVEGFLWTGEGTPNRGLLDQIAALEWVRANIAAFGGDPERVTLAGQSAGAMCVVTLMTMPRAAGLFQRLIAQSGAGENVLDERTARLVARRLARRLDVSPTLEAIAAVGADALLSAVDAIGQDVAQHPWSLRWKDAARTLTPFAPHVDGELVPGLPRDLVIAGRAHDVDLLIGTTSDEAQLFFVPYGVRDSLPLILGWSFVRRFGGHPRAWLAACRRRRTEAVRTADLVSAAMTDGFYRVPALRLAAAMPRSYVYEFAWPSPAFGGAIGACHALDLPFVFGTLGSPDTSVLTGPTPPHVLSDEMRSAWVSFIREGDPGWPRFGSGGAGMWFDTPSRVVVANATIDTTVWPAAR